MAVFCLGCAVTPLASESSSPWQAVTSATCAEEWRRDDQQHYCSALLNLDGDNIPDRAHLITGAGGIVGVAVWIGAFKERDPLLIFTPRKLIRQLQSGAALGIQRLPPGTYETLCGNDLADCSNSDVQEVVIRHDAILLFKDGSWGDVVYFSDDGALKLFGHSD
jgi:hypothetical protein